MTCIRPETAGFISNLIGTALLAVVSFGVPYVKFIFFLKAKFSLGGSDGAITFGTFGYCLELSGGTSCSSPSIGYQLDIDDLVGSYLPNQVPQVAVKWITYALFLHIISLVLSAISAFFCLLSHDRETKTMPRCSTCVSGFAAGTTFLAFVLDLGLFFTGEARVKASGQGYASIGNAIWLTLLAWIMLFFSVCCFAFGNCGIVKGGKMLKWGKGEPPKTGGQETVSGDQDSLNAGVERTTIQANERQGRGSLLGFYDPFPSTGRDDTYGAGDRASILFTPAVANNNHLRRPPIIPNRYIPAPPGVSVVDECHHPTQHTNTTYPPPERQRSYSFPYSPHQHRQPSGYTHSSTPSTNAFLPTPSPSLNSQFSPPAAHRNPCVTCGADHGHTAAGPRSISEPHTPSPLNFQALTQLPPDRNAASPPAYSQYDNCSSPQSPP